MANFTPGPWDLGLVQTFPFGVIIIANGKKILRQDAACHSSEQKTRADCEAGLGFDRHRNDGFITRQQAADLIAEQDANARLWAAALAMLEALKELIAGKVLAESKQAVHPSGRFCTVCGVNSEHRVHSKACPVLAAELAIAKAEGRNA